MVTMAAVDRAADGYQLAHVLGIEKTDQLVVAQHDDRAAVAGLALEQAFKPISRACRRVVTMHQLGDSKVPPPCSESTQDVATGKHAEQTAAVDDRRVVVKSGRETSGGGIERRVRGERLEVGDHRFTDRDAAKRCVEQWVAVRARVREPETDVVGEGEHAVDGGTCGRDEELPARTLQHALSRAMPPIGYSVMSRVRNPNRRYKRVTKFVEDDDREHAPDQQQTA